MQVQEMRDMIEKICEVHGRIDIGVILGGFEELRGQSVSGYYEDYKILLSFMRNSYVDSSSSLMTYSVSTVWHTKRGCCHPHVYYENDGRIDFNEEDPFMDWREYVKFLADGNSAEDWRDPKN